MTKSERAIDAVALEAAFHAHREGHAKFTRRMAINIADHFSATPWQVVRQLEFMSLLKRGSADWFAQNGGFSRDNFVEARADRLAAVRARSAGGIHDQG